MATDPDNSDPALSMGTSAPGNTSDSPAASLTPNPVAAVVLDKLASLDVARKAERERRREESKAAADPRESVGRFLAAFTARQRVIEEALQRMLSQQPGGLDQQRTGGRPPVGTSGAGASGVPDERTSDEHPAPLSVSSVTPEQVQASLELISGEVLSLEQSAAAASYYLPPYDQKQCAATVAALRAAIEGARTSLAPRRRFAFGSGRVKVSKVRGEEVSAAAATNTATSAGGAPAALSSAPAATPVATSAASAPPRDVTDGAGAAASASVLLASSCPPCLRPAVRPADMTMGTSDSSCAAAQDTQTASSRQPAPAGTSGLTASTPGTAAAPAALSSSTSAPGGAGDDAPAALTVSEQDRALVARGRGLMGLTDATVVLRSEEVSEGGAGGDFVLMGLTRCRVVLLGRLRALRAAGLRSCTVLAGPVTGACFVDDVRGCCLALATYQVRVHRTQSTDLFLRVRSKPIIEHSSGIRVAPWAAAVVSEPRLEGLLQAHMLGQETGCWQQVDDFGWIKAVQSPNWSVMPEEAYPRDPMVVSERVWEATEPAMGSVVAGAASGGPSRSTVAEENGELDEI